MFGNRLDLFTVTHLHNNHICLLFSIYSTANETLHCRQATLRGTMSHKQTLEHETNTKRQNIKYITLAETIIDALCTSNPTIRVGAISPDLTRGVQYLTRNITSHNFPSQLNPNIRVRCVALKRVAVLDYCEYNRYLLIWGAQPVTGTNNVSKRRHPYRVMSRTVESVVRKQNRVLVHHHSDFKIVYMPDSFPTFEPPKQTI